MTLEVNFLRSQLVGALIGLARTCSNNLATELTDGLLLAWLHAVKQAILERLMALGHGAA